MNIIVTFESRDSGINFHGLSSLAHKHFTQTIFNALSNKVKYNIIRGEKLNYNSVAKKISKPLFFWFLKSSGHQSLPCLFDSHFLQKFRTTPIFGMSRDHNRKRLKTRTEWVVFEI